MFKTIVQPGILTNMLLERLEKDGETNDNGDRCAGDYCLFLEDKNGNKASLHITEEKWDLEPSEYYYSIHLINNITFTDCKFLYSNNLSKDDLLKIVAEIIESETIASKEAIEIEERSIQEKEKEKESIINISFDELIVNNVTEYIFRLIDDGWTVIDIYNNLSDTFTYEFIMQWNEDCGDGIFDLL